VFQGLRIVKPFKDKHFAAQSGDSRMPVEIEELNVRVLDLPIGGAGSSDIVQEDRIARFVINGSMKTLGLISYKGQENISELFEFTVETVGKPGLDIESLLGNDCHIEFDYGKDKTRYIHGIVTEAFLVSPVLDSQVSAYRVVMRPKHWLMTLDGKNRVFEKSTVVDIISKVLSDAGHAFEIFAKENYPVLEYCVQYQESNFDFLSRIAEEHGICYYFKHSKKEYHIVLADDPSGHPPGDLEGLDFFDEVVAYQTHGQYIYRWHHERNIQPKEVTHVNFDFKRPKAKIIGTANAGGKYPGSLKLPKFPRNNIESSEIYARAELEADRALDSRRHGRGIAYAVQPGTRVTLAGHPNSDQNTTYLVVGAVHDLSPQYYRSGEQVSETEDGEPREFFAGEYVVQPIDTPFRAPLDTPRPYIRGPQTGFVVDDVDPEGYGRVRVKLPWMDQDTSRWCRVAQAWAGSGWGAQFPPRIDMEVVVEFMNGDPDQPIVMGCVYNGQNKWPFEGSFDRLKSGFKTLSEPGSGYNELMFDDNGGSEVIRVHAQRNMDVTVEQDRTATLVRGSDKLDVQAGTRTVTVTGEISITSRSKITLTVGGSSIEISPTGIKLTSLNIAITAPKVDIN